MKVRKELGNNRKGLAERTGVVMFIVSFAAVLITLGVTVLVLDAFNSSTTNTWAQQVFGDGVTMITNFTGQLGTVGTIAGILILVILVALAGLTGYGYARNKGYF